MIRRLRESSHAEDFYSSDMRSTLRNIQLEAKRLDEFCEDKISSLSTDECIKYEKELDIIKNKLFECYSDLRELERIAKSYIR